MLKGRFQQFVLLLRQGDKMEAALRNIKKNILKMVHYSHSSHVGAALSVVDILYTIYSRVANISKSNIASEDRDRVILSKGHSSAALYSVLAEFGMLDSEYLKRYYVDGGILPGHLDLTVSPAIDCSSGSLGHGLSIGIGMALASPQNRVFVIMGDGELNEGSVWEGIIFAGKRKIKNLTLIVDFNKLQGCAYSRDIADYSKLTETLGNFGLDSRRIDGHNLDEIENALKKRSNSSLAIVADTIKGKDVSYMQGQLKWHYKSPNDDELAMALEELDRL